jgi:hypothetical protein
MAANALTITSARHLALDLTKPFMFTGMSIVYKVMSKLIMEKAFSEYRNKTEYSFVYLFTY